MSAEAPLQTMPAMPSEATHLVTLSEFLLWPGDGRAKQYQLFDGEIRAMAPSSPTHGRIQARLAAVVDRRLDEMRSRCMALTEAAIVPRLRAGFNLRIPDLLVTCTPLVAGRAVVDDPLLIVEILSPGNAADTRQNVWAYATIPSLVEILVVHSTRIIAELWRCLPDGSWPAEATIIGPDEALRLDAIGLVHPLADLYAGTPLAATGSDGQ